METVSKRKICSGEVVVLVMQDMAIHSDWGRQKGALELHVCGCGSDVGFEVVAVAERGCRCFWDG